MAAGSTYTPIATQTLGSATATVTFSSIPSTYTDLVLVGSWFRAAGTSYFQYRFNGDTATNYSSTYIMGNGTTASSGVSSSDSSGRLSGWGTGFTISPTETISTIIQINNYSNTTTYKSVLSRIGQTSYSTTTTVSLWRSTAAVNQITIGNLSGTGTFDTGSTFTLYGITAA